MSTVAPAASDPRRRISRKQIIAVVVVVLALLALGRGVKVVSIDSAAAANPRAFSAADFGKAEFPKVVEAIKKRAVPAAILAEAIKANADNAGTEYAVASPGGLGPEFSVSFTGVAGEAKNGVYDVEVTGIPANLKIRVQTGPAINGTDLRDATGTITFGQFVNQMQYQDAGAALNDQLKQEVLAQIDTENLTGRTISVVGAFQLINPDGWLVTPVELTVQ